MVKVFSFATDWERSLNKLGVKMLNFFDNPEMGLFSFPDTERKHKMKDTYLATPFRENQLRQFGSPAVTLVSA